MAKPKLMSEASFWLAYDGEALKAGEMEVADLAPALLAMGQLLRAAGKVAHGSEAQVSVKVQATKKGSFEVLLRLGVEHAGNAWALWKSDDIQAAAQLLGIMGFTVGGAALSVFNIVKRLGGKRPVMRSSETPGHVVLSTEDGELEVPADTARIVLDPAVRAAMEKVVVEPLEQIGIDTVAISDHEIQAVPPAQVIRAEDAPAFKAPALTADDEFTSRYQKPFSINALSFDAGKKWRLSDGHGKSKLITISDEEFIARVERNDVRFAKGDILVCEVIERARRTTSGFKAEYEIARVLEHRPAPASPESLDFGSPTPPDRYPGQF